MIIFLFVCILSASSVCLQRFLKNCNCIVLYFFRIMLIKILSCRRVISLSGYAETSKRSNFLFLVFRLYKILRQSVHLYLYTQTLLFRCQLILVHAIAELLCLPYCDKYKLLSLNSVSLSSCCFFQRFNSSIKNLSITRWC